MLCGRPILLITHMITDRIGLLSVILPLFIGQHRIYFLCDKKQPW